MLAQRWSLSLLGKQIGNKTKATNQIARNITLQSRERQQSPQLFKQQIQLLKQQQRQEQQQKFFSTSSITSYLTFSKWSTIKGNIEKKIPKGSVCLILLPVTQVSCTATLNLTTTAPSALKSSSTTTGNSKSFDNSNEMATEDYKNAKSIYDFTVKDTHGNDVSLDKYKGHVVLIVNIASQCGLTKNNYKKLTDLKEKYHDKGLRILNFPCNQFGSQMPEQDGEAMVCHLRDAKADIGDVFQKVDVNGSNAAPIYQYLKAKQGGTLGSGIKWNFTKFLVNKEGIPVNRYAPTTDPMDIAKDIEKLL